MGFGAAKLKPVAPAGLPKLVNEPRVLLPKMESMSLTQFLYFFITIHLPKAGAAKVAVEAGGGEVAPKDGTLAVVAEFAKAKPVELDAAVAGACGAAKLNPRF